MRRARPSRRPREEQRDVASDAVRNGLVEIGAGEGPVERPRMRTGADLAAIRERKPLVHQITNYVVMNETANATLALGALPVMAHAVEEVEEMAAVAGALVLNIGTLSRPWIEAMLLAAKAANAAGVPVVLDPVGAGATTLRTETAKRILDEAEIAVVRGNAAEVATLAGREAEIRGVESIGAADSGAELATGGGARRSAASPAVTGPVDHVSDGERADRRRERASRCSARSRGTGCMSTAITGLLPRGPADAPLEAAAEALVAFGVAGEDAARGAKGPGTLPRRASTTRSTTSTRRRSTRARRSRRHEAARDRRGLRGRRRAVEGGATVVQLRLKGADRRRRPDGTRVPRPAASRSSSTTTSRPRSRSARTVSTSVATTRRRASRSTRA